MASGNDRIEELESIRGLAAVLVVFFHLPNWNPFTFFRAFEHLYIMVDLFFVLSGFVIYKSYQHKLRTFRDIAAFQALRLGRLYPVHVLFLSLFAAAEVCKVIAIWLYPDFQLEAWPFSNNSLEALWQHLLLIQAMPPASHSATFNVPAWSISVEFWTYLVFAASVACLRNLAWLLFLVLAALSTTLLLILGGSEWSSFLRCVAGFSFGCITAQLTTLQQRRFASELCILPILGIGALLFYKTGTSADLAIYPLTCLLILAIVQSGPNGATRLLRQRQLVRLGELSYSIYMSHAFVIWVFSSALKRRFTAITGRDALGKQTLMLSFPESIIATAVVLTGVLLISVLCNKYVENPVRARARQYISRIWPSRAAI